jgi:hypothetical protein
MSVTVTYSINVSGGGLSMAASIVRSGSAPIGLSETLAAAKTGTLSTRTDDDTGTLTMAGGHAIVDSQEIDIYWEGGALLGATVGTVAGNSVPFDGGTGVLPAQTTPVTVFVRQIANVYIDGDNAKLVSVQLRTANPQLRTAGTVEVYDADDTLIETLSLTTNVPQVYDIEGGSANPFSGAPITYIVFSHAGSVTTEVYQLQIIGTYDATP